MYTNKKKFLLTITFPLLVSFMSKAMNAPEQPQPEPAPISYEEQVKFVGDLPKGQKKNKLKEFLQGTHQKKEEEVQKLEERNDSLRRKLQETEAERKANGERYAADMAAAKKQREDDLNSIKQTLADDEAKAKKAFDDLNAKFQADLQKAQAQTPQFTGPATYKNLPPAADEALTKKYEAKAALAWRKYYFGGLAHTADKILLPAIANELQTYVTYKRQQHWKTPAELQMEELEGRKADHQEVLIMSGELDLEIKRLNLEEMKLNKKSKEAMEDAALQNSNLTNAIQYCKGLNGNPEVCNQLREMAEAVQLAQYRDAYKKQFGKDYVVPKPKPTANK